MSALAIALLIFALVFGAACFGVALQRKLPTELRDTDTKETVQLVMGLVATMAALVLSLLIASSHTFFETQEEEVQKLACDVILLDESFAQYGPEAEALRVTLREDVISATRTMSPDEGIGSAVVVTEPDATGDRPRLLRQVLALAPRTEPQIFFKTKALDLLTRIAATRLLIHEQATSSVPPALAVVMVMWLMLLFVGFGLFARVNATVLLALGLGALSVAGAIFLILDMSHPYRGLIHVSRAPIQSAIDRIGR